MTSAALSANSTMSVLTAARQLSAANRILLLSSHPAAAAPAPCLTPPRRSQYTHTSQDLGTRKDRMDFWGWLGYGRPGYPRTTPLRTPGVDPNLQERLDEMFAERNARRERRRDVGFAPAKVRTLANDRRRAAEWRRQRREDAGLERAARNRTLEVDLDDVKREQRDSGALYHDIRSEGGPGISDLLVPPHGFVIKSLLLRNFECDVAFPLVFRPVNVGILSLQGGRRPVRHLRRPLRP